jgi:hypothetical protein
MFSPRRYLVEVTLAKIPVFLSCPKPHMRSQKLFLEAVEQKLSERNFESRTLGRNDYDMDAPLEGIRRLMVGSCGLVALCFRRTYIDSATERRNADLATASERQFGDAWLTSPYCQIEPAMAFQLGLPMLIWREKGVIADGVLDRGALGISMPEFDLDGDLPDLNVAEWQQPMEDWICRARSVFRRRGTPPALYD